MKLVRILIVALGLLAIAATSAFAVVPFTTTSTSNLLAPNSQTGQAGAVVLTALAAGAIPAGEIITIGYSPATITSPNDISVVIQATTAAAGTFTTANFGTPVAVGTANVTVNAGGVLIAFPAGAAIAVGDTIQVIDPRLNVSGFAVPGGTLNATIASVLGSVSVTNPSVQVMSFVEPISVTLDSPAVVANFTTAGVNTTGGTTSTGTVVVTELFPDAFETKGATTALATQIILRVSNIPAGVTLTGVSAVGSPASATVITPTTPTQTAGTGTAIVYITGQDSTVIEKITATLTFTASGAPISLLTTPVTVAATLGPPIGTAPVNVNAVGLKYAARYVPTPELSILTITQLVTRLLSVFNSWIPGSFNTGIALVNTTGYDATFSALAAQSGAVKVILYPADGSASKNFTTSSTIFGGTGGLNAAGEIPAHGMWRVLVSQLATQAGFTSGFTGQIFFQVAATNIHGVSYISDDQFETQAQGYQMLILPNPRVVPTTDSAAPVGPESLGF